MEHTESDTTRTDETTRDGPPSFAGASRRTVLKTAAVLGAVASTTGLVTAQDDAGEEEDEVTTIVLGGRVEHWFGVAPEAIEGEENPTLQLEADQDYEIVWINMDGEPHEVAIYDENDEELEAAGETVEGVGETQSLEFTATEEMTTYICTVHPETQVGDVEIGDGFEEADGAGGNGGGDT